MGLYLKDIEPYLGPDAPPLRALLAQQTNVIHAEMARLQSLSSMLVRLSAVADSGDEASLSNQLLELMNMRQTIEQHFKPNELNELQTKARDLIDSQPSVQRITGITPALKTYIDQAVPEMKAKAN